MKKKYLIDQISIDWIYSIFQHLEDDMAVEEVVEIAEETGVDFGKRRDVFNRLVDLNMVEKYKENRTAYLRWTPYGEQLRMFFYKSQSKIPYLLHMIQIIQAFKSDSKRYFTTYYLITDILLNSPNKLSAVDSFNELYNRLTEVFPDEVITGIEKSTIGKSLVFLKEVMDENYQPLQFVDPILMAYGIQCYIEAKTGDRGGKLLITANERKELSNVLLIDPAQFEQHIDKSNKYTKAFELRYSTAGVILNTIKVIEI